MIEAAGRWVAAMLLFPNDVYSKLFDVTVEAIQAEAAWTAEGARQLAALLPDELADLRAGIEERFGSIGR